MFSGLVIMLEGGAGAGVFTVEVSIWVVVSDSDAVVVVESLHDNIREIEAQQIARLRFGSFIF